MAISIVNSGSLNNLFAVRGKYGNLSLEFISNNHINVVGAKAKYRLTFSQQSARDNYYNTIIADPYIFLYYDISSEDIDDISTEFSEDHSTGATSKGPVASTTTYAIFIEAKKEGEEFNIDFSTFPTSSTGNFTNTKITIGALTQYKEDYQLSIIALNANNAPLFRKLYPYVSQNGTAIWQIDLAENLAPIVYTSIPNISTSVLSAVPETTAVVDIRYGEAYIESIVNDGKLYFYPTVSQLIEIANFKPQVNEVLGTLGSGYSGSSFDFLTIWDRTRPYPIPCNGTYFLYFYLNSEAAHLEVKTLVYFNDGTSNTFSQTLTNVEKGTHYFPSGPANHPNLHSLSDIKSYSVQVIIGDGDPPDSTSEVFHFKIQDSRNAYEILFLNKFGAFDRIGFDDIENESLKLTPTRYLSTPYDRTTGQTHTGGVATSNIDSDTRFLAIYQSLKGGFYTTELRAWLKDFLASEEKYLLRDGNLYRVTGDKNEHPIQQLDNRVILEFPFTTNHTI